jgi:hypothetical protein
MNKTEQRIWLLATIVFAFLLITFCLTKVVTHPWHLIPTLDADGGKNTYSYLYQVLYGKGFWFTGMNYPYGENIVFTDGQPLLSVTLAYIGHVTIPQALTVLWWLIALSYILSIVYLYKVLQQFGVKPFVAMLFAGLISIFTPQIFSLQGHYGLAYTCVVPMVFWWLIKYNETASRKYPLFILLLGFFTSFLHPYYAPEVLIFVGGYMVGYWVFTKLPARKLFLHLLPLMVSIIMLFGAIGLVMKMTDPITDRPTTPYGMLVYCTTGSQILTSSYSPFWKFAEKKAPFIHASDGGEGYCYPGLVVIITVFISLVTGIINSRRKKTILPDNANTGFSPIWLFTAIFALLFAMGVPFIWHMEWLVNYVSVFRQFRTLGRFSWIFYYIICVYGVIVLYSYYTRLVLQQRRVAAFSLLAGAIALWSIEARGYILFEQDFQCRAEKNYQVLTGDKNYNWPQFLEQHHYHPADFQALLILRFFVCGMDKLWLGRDVSQQCVGIGLVAGVQLHLPWIDNMMARSSWSQTEAQVKIAGGAYVHKPLLDMIKSNKPFLLLHVDSEPLEPDQQYLLTASDSIGHFMDCYVYACYPDRLRANDKKYADSITMLLPYLHTGDTCVRNTGTWYLDHFDSGNEPVKFFGSGAKSQIMQFSTIIASVPVPQHAADQIYEFSCWFLLGDENYRSPYFRIECQDSADHNISVYNALTKESTDNHSLWFRDYAFFPVPARCAFIRCTLMNDPNNTYKVMDELMLRPANSIIISKAADGRIMVNNHQFPATN